MNGTRKIEDRLVPGKSSYLGFLGDGERLDDVLKVDDATVRRLGVSHGKIADRIEYFMKAAFPPTHEGRVIDERYRLISMSDRGFQECPWDDAGMMPKYGNMEFSITNLETGESLRFPGLIAHLIRAHQFYEGMGSPYRVDPEIVVRVLEVR